MLRITAEHRRPDGGSSRRAFLQLGSAGLFGLGLPVLQPGHIATLTLLEPVGATLLGVLILGEQVSATGWLGVVLLLGGLAAVGLGERRG